MKEIVLCLVVSMVLIGCSEKDKLREAVKHYMYKTYDITRVDSMVIGEGDSKNAYVEVSYSDRIEGNLKVTVLVVKNREWKVSKEISKSKGPS